MQAPTTMQFPGPAVVPIQTGTVDQATLDEIRSAIEAAGLNEIDDQSNDAASAQVADASTTVFTYVDAEGDEHRFAIYALGMPEIDYGDAAVSDFEDLLGLMEEAAGTAGDTQLWTPDAVEVFVSPEGLGFDQEFANTQTYPLSMSFDELPAESESAGYRCTTLEGDQAAQLLDAMSEGNEATTFVTDSGDEYSIIVRPLLPGQEGC
jgi:hypothetical protein